MSQETALSVIAGKGSASEAEIEARLTALVLNSVTSAHSRRSYRTGLERFFRLVAVWATKTAMMMDSIKGREAGKRFYTRAECENLRAEQVIPDETRIWLGQYIGDGALGGFGTDFTVVAAELGMQRVARGMANTIVVGRLVLQIVTIHSYPEHLHRNISDVQPKPGDWQDLLIPICPASRTVEWPPKHPFANNKGAHGIGRLMEWWRIGEKVDQLP